jgi:lysozyme family protein
MAEFQPAYTKTNATEGGYANNPADAGGETYKGIARKMHPKWPGWKYIDGVKALATAQPPYGTGSYYNWAKYLNGKLAALPQLQSAVSSFYKTDFWDANRLGEIANQDVSEWVYDHVVNAGARGMMWIQLAASVKPDGELGRVSIAAINAADPVELLNRAEDIAGAYRLDRAAAKPSQIQFLTSWLDRDGQPASIVAMVKKAASDGLLDATEVATLKTAMAATA